MKTAATRIPGDAEPTVDQAIGHGAGGHVRRHVEDSESNGDADGEGVDVKRVGRDNVCDYPPSYAKG